MTNNLISDILFLHTASLKSRCSLFIFIILVFILDFRLVRKLVFLYLNVKVVYLKEIPSINKITITSTCKGSKRGGGSKGGARGPPPPTLFLDQTEAQRAQRNFLGDKPTSYLRVWMSTPPPHPSPLISRFGSTTEIG